MSPVEKAYADLRRLRGPAMKFVDKARRLGITPTVLWAAFVAAMRANGLTDDLLVELCLMTATNETAASVSDEELRAQLERFIRVMRP